MLVRFYKEFHKDVNSTKHPVDSNEEYEDYDCVLTEPTSLMNPEIIVNTHIHPSFARIESFSRYYYVTDVIYEGQRRTRIQLTEDVLSTYRTQIRASTQYVVRAESTFDGDLVDSFYPTKTNPSAQDSAANVNPFKSKLAEGCYVVGIISSNASNVGAIAYYCFSPHQFGQLKQFLMGDPEWMFSGITEMSQALFKSIISPFDYIASVKWFPFAPFGVEVKQIEYGWWKLPVTCNYIATGTHVKYYYVGIPLLHHPQRARGSFTESRPYTDIMLDWPAAGEIPIDGGKLVNCDTLSLHIFVDTVSGEAQMNIVADGPVTNKPVQTVNFTVGMSIQLSQINVDGVGAINGLVGGVASAFTKNIGGAISGIASAAESLIPQQESISQNGNLAKYEKEPYLHYYFYSIADEAPHLNGRPLMQDKVLSSLSGYIKTENAHFEMAKLLPENEKIESYMNGGIYLE